MSSLGRASILSQQLNAQSPALNTPPSDEERRRLIKQRQEIDARLGWSDTAIPRYAGLDLATAAIGSNNNNNNVWMTS